jgi:hypothetical protein
MKTSSETPAMPEKSGPNASNKSILDERSQSKRYRVKKTERKSSKGEKGIY